MKRFLSVFLVLVFATSLCVVVPASAVSESGQELPVVGVLYDNSFYTSLDNKFSLLSNIDQGVTKTLLWNMMDKVVSTVGFGGFTTYRDLSTACASVNRYFSDAGVSIWSGFSSAQAAYLQFAITNVFSKLNWVISEHPDYGYVIVETGSGVTLCNSAGAFPYYKTVVDTSAPDSDLTETLGGKWVREDQISTPILYNVVNEATLYDMGQALKDTGKSANQNKIVQFNGSYQVIMSTIDDHGFQFVYCDSKGRPYAYRPDSNQWAQENNNNYYTDNSNSSDDDTVIFNQGDTENNTLIDVDSNTVWFPDGTLYYISQLVYDESTKTYYVDAHSEYDIDNNYYISNNYYYEYHINYTSITYIGASEEYNKTYELYYELPDGRSSADLTADELLALNTSIDVVPYIRSSDNTSLRSLYHFDANVNDSSYWSYLTNFTWNTGASITYLESNAFNGCLYLDEGEHDFTLTLPSSLGAKDFTLQFRYYQSNTLAPVTDSYISFGNTQVLSMNGGAFFLDGSSVDTPIGNWSEIALVRHGNNLYLYINGVAELVTEADRSFTNEITFHFGSEQQTYKQLDELRILDFAIAEDGAYYTPTAVPYDTNLALVLPDSTLPVADEYWSFNANGNLFPTYDYTVGEVPDGLFSKLDAFDTSTIKWGDVAYHYSGKWGVYYRSGSVLSDFLVVNPSSVQFSNPSTYTSYSSTSGPLVGFSFGLAFCTNTSTEFTPMNPLGLIEGRDYTFTVMLSDGDSASVTFTYNGFSKSSSLTSALLTSGCRIGVCQSYQGYAPTENDLSEYITAYSLFIIPPAQSSVDVIYMELVEGDTPNSGHELLSYIAPIADFKTPTLAVRTDLEITGYQIGGVRPSLPTKGLVWALVEDGRITSLQIYNGQAWEAVDGRIWTGSRWVPYYAYDVLLLKDMYDIIEADPSQEYIYTESGFWSWLQRAWAQMMGKLDQIIEALGGQPGGSASDCQHVYEDHVDREPTCAEPGYRTYTCTICGHAYTELIDATGHDWVVTNSVPDVLDEEGNVVEEGYDELTCSICGAESRDYGDGPEEQDIFDALGDFIADGITWILEKLTELADSLRSITDIFNGFVEKAGALAGSFPAFFGAFVALIPEDLQTVIWFSVVAFVVIAVWKKWSE